MNIDFQKFVVCESFHLIALFWRVQTQFNIKYTWFIVVHPARNDWWFSGFFSLKCLVSFRFTERFFSKCCLPLPPANYSEKWIGTFLTYNTISLSHFLLFRDFNLFHISTVIYATLFMHDTFSFLYFYFFPLVFICA